VLSGPSLYSVGWLNGGHAEEGALTFPDGARWELSLYRKSVAERVFEGARAKPEVAYGMRVVQVEREPTPEFGGMYRFTVGSPVLTRQRREDGGRDHLIHSDPDADATLTRTLRYKMETAGFEDSDREVMVGFDRSYDDPRTKLVSYQDINFRGSICPVIVAGSPAAVQFAYDVGAGELTGCGFGFLEKS
jgi:CRISPR-associated endoribonuclease Cas6